MKKVFCLTGLSFLMVFLAVASSPAASEISRITLAELEQKADFIVTAQVTGVVAEGDEDRVTIKVENYLKGNSPESVFSFSLVPRGRLKDFDPSLKTGDAGVFFLKNKKKEGLVEKAYWGSVALFVKNHFDLTVEKVSVEASKAMALWRAYRVKLGQARNVSEYEGGFLKGYMGPTDLTPGSADYNLGLSDGKLASKGIVPAW